ncbi:DUF5131 family protein [Oceanibacterium hippocampi]|uniref:Phage protein Gp37/Gp68 n=1 Tax=Oceanibacterium hippocampi TaxID=745714 RepID=A0A1Y5U2C9_9PROT|nr:phage Gp37/Gp68 family protein [Oceanibacterium hippocampi]SLN77274.1 Phage protein Gp37/Gp68 [Oceanibacterium hippocampi]
MGDHSKIEWTDATWNPIRGCSRVSQGCVNCYAERVAARFSKPGQAYAGVIDRHGRWNGRIRLVEHKLDEPLRWKKPRRIFVNSMSDLFHEAVPVEVVDHVFAVMRLAAQHRFQILTKRPARMRAYLADRSTARATSRGEIFAKLAPGHLMEGCSWPLRNVWLGVSIEDQATADARIPDLLATPAAVRFVSYEPAIGPVDLSRAIAIDWQCTTCRSYFSGPHRPTCPGCGAVGGWCGSHAFNGRGYPDGPIAPSQRGAGIDWIICGGESGPGARPMHPDWARSVRDQCRAAGVPFFFKQWGEWAPTGQSTAADEKAAEGDFFLLHSDGGIDVPDDRWPDDESGEIAITRIGKKAGGALLDGVAHREFPDDPGA